MSQAKKITMVSTGSGEVGAAKLTGEVLDIVTRVPLLVKNMTGVDITKVNNVQISNQLVNNSYKKLVNRAFKRENNANSFHVTNFFAFWDIGKPIFFENLLR